MRRRPAIVSTLLAIAVVAAPAAGDLGRLNHLLIIDGGIAWVKYTPGALDRASHVHDWLQPLALAFYDWSKRSTVLGAYVIDHEEWRESGRSRPYGVPEVMAPGEVVVPAYGDRSTVDRWRGLVGQLPTLGEAPLRGSADEAASLLVADQLALLELARTLVGPGGLELEEPWLNDVAAHLMVLAANRDNPAFRATIDGFYARLGAVHAGEAGPLAAFRSGVSFEGWLWYQSRFHAAAEIVLAEDPRNPLKRFLKMQRKTDDGELGVADLLDRYERLEGWLQEFPESPRGQEEPNGR